MFWLLYILPPDVYTLICANSKIRMLNLLFEKNNTSFLFYSKRVTVSRKKKVCPY